MSRGTPGPAPIMPINWEYVLASLPTAQDPESRAERRRLFDSLDRDRSRALSLDEARIGLQRLLADHLEDIKEMEVACKAAFDVSRHVGVKKSKRKAKKIHQVARNQFHAFLVAFRNYLELAELFEFLDDSVDDNQLLSRRECNRGLAQLQKWGITSDDLDERFSGVDVWVSHLSFKDFSKWCIEHRFANGLALRLDDSDNEEVQYQRAADNMRRAASIRKTPSPDEMETSRQRVATIFRMWDEDRSGGIGEEELVHVLLALDSKLKPERAREMFRVADVNKDGVVDYEEFCRWLFN